MEKISLMIIEDHSLELDGMIQRLKDSAPHIHVVTTQDGNKAFQLVRETQPDVILMDIVLKGSQKNGLELTEEILKRFPVIRILMFSNHLNDAFLLKAMEVGASGYLLKTCTREALRLAIEAAHKGMLVFDTEMAQSVRHIISGRERVLHWGILTEYSLTKRQVEVTRCWYEAHDRSSMADPVVSASKRLGLEIKNVQDRLSEVCKIFGVKRADLYDTITDTISCIG